MDCFCKSHTLCQQYFSFYMTVLQTPSVQFSNMAMCFYKLGNFADVTGAWNLIACCSQSLVVFVNAETLT